MQIFNQLSLIGKALGVANVSEMGMYMGRLVAMGYVYLNGCIELPKGIEDVRLLSERLQSAQVATRSTAKDIVDLAQRWMSRNDRVHEEYNQKTGKSWIYMMLWISIITPITRSFGNAARVDGLDSP